MTTSEAAPKAFKVQGRRLRFYRFFRWTDIAKIRLGIEGCLEFLSIDLSILVQNVSIDTGYHVDLGMACIALDLESLVEQLQKSPELASALAALIAAQAPAK